MLRDQIVGFFATLLGPVPYAEGCVNGAGMVMRFLLKPSITSRNLTKDTEQHVNI
jgi:hypothetical protein